MGLEVDEGERALSPDGSGKSSTTNPWDAPSRKSSASSAKNPWDEPRRPSAGTGTGAAPGAGNPWNEAQVRPVSITFLHRAVDVRLYCHEGSGVWINIMDSNAILDPFRVLFCVHCC
jgi:hypothetical protein